MLLAPSVAQPPDYRGAIKNLESLPAELGTARVRLGLTVAAQAKEIGVSATTLANLYRGGTDPSFATAIRSLYWLSQNWAAP